jgi:hypothetical protein
VVTDIEDKLNKVALKMAELEHMVDESLQWGLLLIYIFAACYSINDSC